MIWDDIVDWCQAIEAELQDVKRLYERHHVDFNEGNRNEYARLRIAAELAACLGKVARQGAEEVRKTEKRMP